MSKKIAIGLVGLGLGLWGLRQWSAGGKNPYHPNMQNKVVLVTGGSAGIGKETCREIAKLGATVLITGRDGNKAKRIVEEIKKYHKEHNLPEAQIDYMLVDFTNIEDVRNFAKGFIQKYNKLDILVNNAGMMNEQYIKSPQGVEKTMAVNYLAPILLTSLLWDTLKKTPESRILNVSSIAHDKITGLSDGPKIEDFLLDNVDKNGGKGYDKMVAYSNSKFGNIVFTHYLKQKIEKEGLNMKAVSLHPGVVQTEFSRDQTQGAVYWLLKGLGPIMYFLSKDEVEGAQTSLACALMPYKDLQNGAFYSDCVAKPSSPASNDPKEHKRIWDLTVQRMKQITKDTQFFGE